MSAVELWTADDAARVLDPPLSLREVRAMLGLFGVPARGALRSGYARGRPPALYAATDVLAAHAIVIKARSRFGGFQLAPPISAPNIGPDTPCPNPD